jgi:hypothetical protein
LGRELTTAARVWFETKQRCTAVEELLLRTPSGARRPQHASSSSPDRHAMDAIAAMRGELMGPQAGAQQQPHSAQGSELSRGPNTRQMALPGSQHKKHPAHGLESAASDVTLLCGGMRVHAHAVRPFLSQSRARGPVDS